MIEFPPETFCAVDFDNNFTILWCSYLKSQHGIDPITITHENGSSVQTGWIPTQTTQVNKMKIPSRLVENLGFIYKSCILAQNRINLD